MRRIGLIMGAVLFLLLGCLCSAGAEEGGQPVLRALLIACDQFVTQDDTTPAAQTNVALMEEALSRDGREYALIRSEKGTVATIDAFRAAVSGVFSGAQAGDISLIYISTHGLYNPARSSLTASLLLSDGLTEEELTAADLSDILSPIPGVKVLIIDACNSGALIGKGLNDPNDRGMLRGADIKVLCSAGGSEESWYWRSGPSGEGNGAGYFTSVLAAGLSPGGEWPADENGDGTVTLHELYRYMLDHFAASTPQVYPQEEDGFALFAAETSEEAGALDAVRDIWFDDTVFTGDLTEITFSFEITRPVGVAYQLVYDRAGVWDFASAPMLWDGENGETLEPGWYQRTLSLGLADEDTDVSGYLMLQIYSEENDRLTLHDSRLLSVLPIEGDVALRVDVGRFFQPSRGEEMAALVRHDIPCLLTVSVQDMLGETVRYLARSEPTRPEHLTPEGDAFYWDGSKEDGTPAEPGRYMIKVRTEAGGDTYFAYSSWFKLSRGENAG